MRQPRRKNQKASSKAKATKPAAAAPTKPKTKSAKDKRAPSRPKVPPFSPIVKLTESMIGAWRKTVLGLARFPRGLDRRELKQEELLEVVLRQEAGTVGRLWEIFTQSRGDLGKHMLGDRQNVVGYLLGFHLPNAARAQVTWERAAGRHPLGKWLAAAKGPVVWHDLGAGTGAVAHATLEFLVKSGVPGPMTQLHLYDNTGPLLDASRLLFESAALGTTVMTHKVPLERLAPERMVAPNDARLTGYSLGYVWNELKRNPEGKSRVLKALAGPVERRERALVLVLEPALQDIARDAMALRDQLVALGYAALYPCPASKRCPMLERPRDWCYSEGQLHRPRELRLLDTRLGMDRSILSGGLYLFASPALAAEIGVAPLERPVVVGRPSTPQGYDYLLCEGQALAKQSPKSQSGQPLARGLQLGD